MIAQTVLSIFLSVGIFGLAFHLKTSASGLESNLSALAIVMGGSLTATLFAYPWRKIVWTFQVLKRAFQEKDEMDGVIDGLVECSRTFRNGGIRALEREAQGMDAGLLKTSIELMAFQCSREKIEQIVEREAQLICIRYETAHKILYSLAKLAPALGLVGTIVTLIRVFGQMGDPKSLVGSMAVALLSTFYGVVLANLCFVPLSNKLKEFMDREEIRLGVLHEGILDLYDGENPRLTQFKLETLSDRSVQGSSTRKEPRLALLSPKRRVSSLAS
jgi:chemotaxis protein MotA